MSRSIQMGTVTIYRVIDNETGNVVFETLDAEEALSKADFPEVVK